MHPPTRRSPRRSSGSEKVFADDQGRLWSASQTRDGAGEAIVFACISDSRQPVRAMATSADCRLGDANDGTLREWLASAPRMGRLT